jgi:hypothetical protein
LSLNMHSQQSMSYTHRAAGRGQRRDTRQHSC